MSYPSKDATNINYDFKKKHGVELNIFSNYDEVFFVSEVLVLDDVDNKFESKLFGVSVVEIRKDASFSEEHCIYFEAPGQSLFKKIFKQSAEIISCASILLHVSDDELSEPNGFEQSENYRNQKVDFIRSHNKSIDKTPMMVKLKGILQKLSSAGFDIPDELDDDGVFEEAKRRVNLPLSNLYWASMKYLIPFKKTNGKVYIRIQGFLNLENDIMFCRALINPDEKGKKRPIYSPGVPDFDEKSTLSRLKTKEIALDLSGITEKHHILLDVLKVTFTGGKQVKMIELGFCFIPLLNDDGYLNFGRVMIPVYGPALDWSSVDEFNRHNPWDLLEILIEDNQQIQKTNRYVIMTITDDYRRVRFASRRTISKTMRISPNSSVSTSRTQTGSQN